ncbi:MAG: CDP-diacylglycerol--glycerol-3-phosphate 3-phosphatidyltransferase, partial [Actinomycetota bacterium]
VQQFAVGLCILPLTVDMRWLWLSVLWASVVLTLVSGAQYLWKARSADAPVVPSATSVT